VDYVFKYDGPDEVKRRMTKIIYFAKPYKGITFKPMEVEWEKLTDEDKENI